ncbi:hypothetical protein PFISCL1PPCAC_26670, partial [Pristionchus fissidentatus]
KRSSPEEMNLIEVEIWRLLLYLGSCHFVSLLHQGKCRSLSLKSSCFALSRLLSFAPSWSIFIRLLRIPNQILQCRCTSSFACRAN